MRGSQHPWATKETYIPATLQYWKVSKPDDVLVYHIPWLTEWITTLHAPFKLRSMVLTGQCVIPLTLQTCRKQLWCVGMAWPKHTREAHLQECNSKNSDNLLPILATVLEALTIAEVKGVVLFTNMTVSVQEHLSSAKLLTLRRLHSFTGWMASRELHSACQHQHGLWLHTVLPRLWVCRLVVHFALQHYFLLACQTCLYSLDVKWL